MMTEAIEPVCISPLITIVSYQHRGARWLNPCGPSESNAKPLRRSPIKGLLLGASSEVPAGLRQAAARHIAHRHCTQCYSTPRQSTPRQSSPQSTGSNKNNDLWPRVSSVSLCNLIKTQANSRANRLVAPQKPTVAAIGCALTMSAAVSHAICIGVARKITHHAAA